MEYIQNFYSSIPDRLNKIDQCNGKNIKFWTFLLLVFNGFCIYVRIDSADFIDRPKLFSQ